MDATSRLLNLHVSFRWRKVVSLKLIDEIKKWTLPSSKKEIRPSLIFMGYIIIYHYSVGITNVVWTLLVIIGISVHHMFPDGGVPLGTEIYIKHLQLLVPNLHQLTSVNKVRVIWMYSQSTLDSAYFEHKVTGSYVHLYKVFRYNQLARDIISKVLF